MVIWRKISYNWRLVNNFVMQRFHPIIVLTFSCFCFGSEQNPFGILSFAAFLCPFCLFVCFFFRFCNTIVLVCFVPYIKLV